MSRDNHLLAFIAEEITLITSFYLLLKYFTARHHQ
jgi:hypothetical protein